MRSFCGRLGGGKDCDGVEIAPRPAYIIEGEEVGRGNDGEPIIANVHVLERMEYDPEELLQFAVSEMTKNFSSVKFEGSSDGCRSLCNFYVDKKVNLKTGEERAFYEPTSGKGWESWQYMEYLLAGWVFWNPIGNFCE